MPIPPVSGPPPAQSLSNRPPKPESARPRTGSDAPAAAAGGGAAVRLSEQAQRVEVQQRLLSEVLVRVEGEVPAADDLFEQAGRSQYLESIASPTDLSPEATAGRILGGITGYIYGAFRLQHPEMTGQDFEHFKAEALRGFEQGMGEARQILGALEVLDGKLADEVGETERLVREGLDRFFAEEGERLSGARAA